MERRERYDPEDIESLLSERSFDALLDEERAFVLRHLSGREEYEQMRALLHYVRPDERSRRDDLEPDERVRQHVLAAFRAQKQPHWRIWLNTLAAWAAPTDTTQLWRPALAFGSLALLVVAGYVAVNSFKGNSNSGLAELEKLPRRVQEERAVPAPASADGASEADRSNDTVDNGAQLDAQQPSSVAAARNGTEAVLPSSELGDDRSFAAKAEADEIQEDVRAVEHRTKDSDMAETRFSEQEFIEVPTVGHVVTAEEFARNLSTTNATGSVKATTSKRSGVSERSVTSLSLAESRSVATDPGILGLLAAGW